MRIRRLDLTRYGMFTNQLLDLPRGEFDFHLIYGPNEAGKSTIRNAVVDLFYGINRTSPFNFVHEYSEMCIGALVEADGKSLDFQRLKRNKGSLVDPVGKALPDNVLVPFLGGTDQEFFLRMFALDHQNMVSGGSEILNSSGDLGQMLFQAAAGLGSLQAIKEKLEAEADGLWGPKAKESRAYYQALGRMEEAKARLHEVRVTSNKWTTARRALDTADDQLTATENRRNELKILCDRFERVQRVSPLAAQLHDVQKRIDAMGPVIRLLANATATLAAAEIEIEAANAQAQIHRKTIQDAEGDLLNFIPDAPILAHAAEVPRLAGLVASVHQAERDIPKRENEVAEQTQLLLGTARQVGWEKVTPEDVSDRLPLEPLRAEIEELLARHSTLKSAMDLRANDVAQAQTMLQAISNEEATLPAAAEYPALAAALKPAQSLNPDERNEELAEEVAGAKRKLDEALSDLAPWNGDAAALALTRPADAAEVQRLLDARKRLDADLDKAQQGITDRQLALTGVDTELNQKRREHHLATTEELSAARQRRDATFGRIVAGEVAAASVAAEYGEDVRVADTLADRRYEEAQDTAWLQALANQSEKLRAEMKQLKEQRELWAGQLADLQSDWEARTAELALSGISLDRVTFWIQQRTAALAAVTAMELSRGRAETFAARVQARANTLRAELGKAGAEVPPTADLPTLITLADDILSAAVQNRTRRDALDKQKRDMRSKLKVAQDEAKRARDAMDVWAREWATKLAEANLPAGSSQAAVSKAIDLFRTMDKHLEKIRDLQQSRIGPMRRDIDQFNADAATLVAACATDLTQKPTTGAVAELAARLTKAQADHAEHERARLAIVTANASLEESIRKRAQAQARLKPLLDQAAVSEIEVLREAISKSDRALALDREAQQYRTAAIAAGGGMALEDLEKEVAGVELAQLGTQLEEAKRQLAEITKQRDECLQRRALAEADYSRIAGTDEAAKAEACRQAALVEMGAAADEYVRVWTGARLLKWALERYREEKQGPLLAAASEFFSHLTNGQHAKLLVETGDTLRLISRKADGSKVGVEGMSDGTSDQLYLALRLAALELDLEGGTPLPFIADDLLINCDNERAASSFAAFARLASKTQVLYFTHHRHLIDIAQRASDNRVNVVEI